MIAARVVFLILLSICTQKATGIYFYTFCKLLLCCLGYSSESCRPFWTIFGHSEALESLVVLNLSWNLRSSKETQRTGIEISNKRMLDLFLNPF